MVTKRPTKRTSKSRNIPQVNLPSFDFDIPSFNFDLPSFNFNHDDDGLSKSNSITNHDLRKRLFKKKCHYCGMPLDEHEKSYPVYGKHSKDNDKMYCSLCHNLRLNRWR